MVLKRLQKWRMKLKFYKQNTSHFIHTSLSVLLCAPQDYLATLRCEEVSAAPPGVSYNTSALPSHMDGWQLQLNMLKLSPPAFFFSTPDFSWSDVTAGTDIWPVTLLLTFITSESNVLPYVRCYCEKTCNFAVWGWSDIAINPFISQACYILKLNTQYLHWNQCKRLSYKLQGQGKEVWTCQ